MTERQRGLGGWEIPTAKSDARQIVRLEHTNIAQFILTTNGTLAEVHEVQAEVRVLRESLESQPPSRFVT